MMVRTRKPVFTASRVVWPVLWMALVVYTGYHVMHGERGLYALVREQAERTTLKKELADTQRNREKMEMRVSHLRDDSLDRDLLDEQMRRMLGVMHKGEVVILNGPQS